MLLDGIIIVGFLIVIGVVLVAHRKRVAVQVEVRELLSRIETHLKAKP